MSVVLKAIEAETDTLWPEYDVDASGELDRDEFEPFCLDVLKSHGIAPGSNSKHWMDMAFDIWYRDGSGLISCSEAHELLKMRFIILIVESKFASLDEGGSGALSKQQFRVFARECLDVMGFLSDWMAAELDVLAMWTLMARLTRQRRLRF